MDKTTKRKAKVTLTLVFFLGLLLAGLPQPGSAQLLTVTWHEEDFEDDDGGWEAYGFSTNPDYGHWSWGPPTSPPNTLPGMTNVWGVDLDGTPPSQLDGHACTFVESAPIVLPSLQDPLGVLDIAQIELVFQVWFDTSQATEAASLSISTDGNETWESLDASGYNPWFWVNEPAHSCLGAAGSPQFHTGVAWTGQAGPGASTWTENTVDLTPYQGEEVILRFGYGSDAYYWWTRGVFIDDVRIDLHVL